MTPPFSKCIQTLGSLVWLDHLRGIKRGLEKESLRVDKKGNLSTTAHPIGLGSSLTHPFITTDYSEALLEFITPPLSDIEETLLTLDEIHQYTYHVLKDELLWASSMPCKLPVEEKIPIANYGQSNLGILKHVYRRGLGHRYGRIMQTIAGVHYNFSLPNSFWMKYKDFSRSNQSDIEFISEQYLALCRNVLRFGWLLPLLMGASPAVSSSFFKNQKPGLEDWKGNTWIGPHATSLRLSDLGYHNNIQSRCSISYNSFSEFLSSLKKAVHTPAPEYQRMGIKKEGEYLQLNDTIFQVEDEHYTWIRPKRVTAMEERTLSAMSRAGIEYLEIRALDVNPFYASGIEKEMIYFLDAFLVTCLLMESPPITEAEHKIISYNHTRTVKEGLKPGITLMSSAGKELELIEIGMEILSKIQVVAEILNKAYGSEKFTRSCEKVKQRISFPDQLPAARVLQELRDKEESYLEFARRWSLKHQRYFCNKKLDPLKLAFYQKTALDSIEEQKKIEHEDNVTFDEYLKNYLMA